MPKTPERHSACWMMSPKQKINLRSGSHIAEQPNLRKPLGDMERAKGIEPSSVVGWEGGLAATLPPQNRA